jgi:hypothetical protein
VEANAETNVVSTFDDKVDPCGSHRCETWPPLCAADGRKIGLFRRLLEALDLRLDLVPRGDGSG